MDEAFRIAEAITASHAESTCSMYDWAWSKWEAWCATRGVVALPAEPALICAYLTERAADGLSVGTIDTACSAISYTHRRHGLSDAILTEAVRQVRRGLRLAYAASSEPHCGSKPDPSEPRTSVRSSRPSTGPPSRAPAMLR